MKERETAKQLNVPTTGRVLMEDTLALAGFNIATTIALNAASAGLSTAADVFAIAAPAYKVPFMRHKIKKMQREADPKFIAAQAKKHVEDFWKNDEEMEVSIQNWVNKQNTDIEQRIEESVKRERKAKSHIFLYPPLLMAGRAALLLAFGVSNPVGWLTVGALGLAAVGSGYINYKVQQAMTDTYRSQYQAVELTAEKMREETIRKRSGVDASGDWVRRGLGLLARGAASIRDRGKGRQ